jgi:tRNA G18 (ribose-2'-O)-methylase SpoU
MTMRSFPITSLTDPRVAIFRNVRDADMRGRDHLFMAESELVLRRLLRTPDRLHSILLSEDKLVRLEAALQGLPAQVPVYVADLKLIHEIAAFHIHRGILAAGVRLPPEKLALHSALGHLKQKNHLRLVLAEGITNVDNMGALFRNAAAFGVDGIVLDPSCCDPLYRKAIRVSMGHVLSIPYAISANWHDDLAALKNQWGCTIIAAELQENSIPPWSLPRSDRMAIVLGAEGHGVSQSTIELCDHVCAIPMSNEVPSINVAVASAVLLYELRRGERD